MEIGSAFISIMPSMKGVGSSLQKGLEGPSAAAGKSAGGIMGKAIGVGIAGAVAAGGIGKALYEIGQSFDDMSDTIAVGTGASGKALARLEQTAKNIGKTTPSSFADIGQAVAGLNQRLGLTGKPLEAMATKVLNLSRITGTDLTANISDLTRTFGDWSISLKDQPAALDKIFVASQKTGVGINSLAQSVVQMGAPLRQFGFSFEESLAMFGKWEKEGVNTTAVMSGLKIGLGKFSKAGLAPKQALEDVTAAIKNAGSAGEANQIAIEAFGQRAGPDMAAAVREGRFELGSLVKSIQGSGGAIDKADKGTRDFAETWQVFKNNVLLKLEPIATRVFSGFSDFSASQLPKLISGFDSVSAAVNSFVADFKAGVGVGGQFASAFGAIGTVLTTLGSFIMNNKAAVGTFVGVILTVVAGIKAWTIAQVALNIALTANPIGLVVVAIAALAAGLVYAYKKSETFRTIVNAVFEFLKTAVTTVVSFVTDHWKLIVVAITGPLGAVALLVAKHWDTIKSAVTTAVSTVINFVRDHWRLIITIIGGPLGLAVALVTKYWGQIKAATSAVWNAIKAVVSAQVSGIKAAISGIAGLVGSVRNWFGQMLSAIKDKLGDAVSFVKTIPGKIKGALGNLGSLLLSAGADVVRGLVNGIKGSAHLVVDAAKALADSLPGWVKKVLGIASPSKVFHQIGQWTMEGFANGIDAAGPKVLKSMKDALDKTIDKVTEFRDNLKSRLDSVKSLFDSVASSVSSAFSADLFQAANVTEFFSGLANQNNTLRAMLKAFKKLKGWGIPSAFLSQLFASGNSALILELASDRGNAEIASGAFNFGQSLSQQLGQQVAQNQYGAQISGLDAKLARIEKHTAHLENLEKKLAHAINASVSHGQKKGAAA